MGGLNRAFTVFLVSPFLEIIVHNRSHLDRFRWFISIFVFVLKICFQDSSTPLHFLIDMVFPHKGNRIGWRLCFQNKLRLRDLLKDLSVLLHGISFVR